jgi:hypothetical protein
MASRVMVTVTVTVNVKEDTAHSSASERTLVPLVHLEKPHPLHSATSAPWYYMKIQKGVRQYGIGPTSTLEYQA